MVKDRKFYDLLDIQPDASPFQVKKAYRSAALKHHPDRLRCRFTGRGVDDEAFKKATEAFQCVKTAYEILSDEKKRHVYDSYGEAALASNLPQQEQQQQQQQQQGSQYPASQQQQQQGSQYPASHQQQQKQGCQFPFTQQPQFPCFMSKFKTGESLFDDIFSASSIPNPISGIQNIFNNISSNFAQRGLGCQLNNAEKSPVSDAIQMKMGKNIHHNIGLSLVDFYKGRVTMLKLVKAVQCVECGAKGGSRVFSCPTCMGHGTIVQESYVGMNYQRFQSTCAACSGSGQFIPPEFVCQSCKGQKLVDIDTYLNVRVPRGVKPGFKITFPHEADEGINIIPGDVIITIKDGSKQSFPNFERRGDNLVAKVQLPLKTAICGGLFKLQHLNSETLKIYINRGDLVNPSSLKVAKGYGMPIHKTVEQVDQGEEVDDRDLAYGDLIIKFDIVFPKMGQLSDLQYNMIEKALSSSQQKKKQVSSQSTTYPRSSPRPPEKHNNNNQVFNSSAYGSSSEELVANKDSPMKDAPTSGDTISISSTLESFTAVNSISDPTSDDNMSSPQKQTLLPNKANSTYGEFHGEDADAVDTDYISDSDTEDDGSIVYLMDYNECYGSNNELSADSDLFDNDYEYCPAKRSRRI